MTTIQFRYGFHPEGFDPLLTLRATQPATASVAPGATVPSAAGDLSARTTPRDPSPQPPHCVRRNATTPRRAWNKWLWAAVVLVSAGTAGTVWSTSEDPNAGTSDTEFLAFAPPTVIEPDALPSGPSDEPATVNDAVVKAAVSSSTSPSTSLPSSSPSTSSPSSPSTSSPSSPPASPQSPVSPLPTFTFPPAIVWTPAPAKEAPPKPPVVTPETSERRPGMVLRPEVQRPEVRPSIKPAPTAQPRTPVFAPKVPRPTKAGAGKVRTAPR